MSITYVIAVTMAQYLYYQDAGRLASANDKNIRTHWIVRQWRKLGDFTWI